MCRVSLGGGSACERSERNYASRSTTGPEGLASSEALGKETLEVEVLWLKCLLKRFFSETLARSESLAFHCHRFYSAFPHYAGLNMSLG